MKKVSKFLFLSSVVTFIGFMWSTAMAVGPVSMNCNTIGIPAVFNSSYLYDPLVTPKDKTFTDSRGIKWIMNNALTKGNVGTAYTRIMINSTGGLTCQFKVGSQYTRLQMTSTNVKSAVTSGCSGVTCNVTYTLQ